MEIWYHDLGGYNGAISGPMVQYLQAEFKDLFGVTMNIKVMPTKDRMAGLMEKKNNLFLAPYEYDHLESPNFYGIFNPDATTTATKPMMIWWPRPTAIPSGICA